MESLKRGPAVEWFGFRYVSILSIAVDATATVDSGDLLAVRRFDRSGRLIQELLLERLGREVRANPVQHPS